MRFREFERGGGGSNGVFRPDFESVNSRGGG